MHFSLVAVVGLVLSCVACTEQSVVTVAPDEFHFHGVPKRVRGIPIKRIRRDWCKAIELTKEMFPPEAFRVDGHDTMAAAGVAFAVDGFLDGTSVEQTALVGVYESCSSEKGGFLLILDKSSVFTGKVRFLSTYVHTRPFDALQVQPNGVLTVMHCLECDFISYLYWDKATGTFVWQKEDEETPSQ